MQEYIVGFVGIFFTALVCIWLISRPSSKKPLSKAELGHVVVLSLLTAVILTVLYFIFFGLLPDFLFTFLHLHF
jgi:hypothetical protein